MIRIADDAGLGTLGYLGPEASYPFEDDYDPYTAWITFENALAADPIEAPDVQSTGAFFWDTNI